MPGFFQRWIMLAGLTALVPQLCGFVLLRGTKATLRATPEDPVVTLVWNGSAPTIKDKDKFQDGAYQDLDDTDFMRQLLQIALGVWSNVPGTFLKLELAEDSAAALDPKDGQHSIVVEHSKNLSTAAYASPQITDDEPDTISDCDINVSDRAVSAKELAFTLVHELGHCVGLGHAHTNYNAIMGYSRSARTLRLGADDMAGIIYLYPDPNYEYSKPKELIGCGTVAGLAGLSGISGMSKAAGSDAGASPTLLRVLLVISFAAPIFLVLARRLIEIAYTS